MSFQSVGKKMDKGKSLRDRAEECVEGWVLKE